MKTSGDILRQFGPESSPGSKRAECGGVCVAKELPYSPPVGPKGQSNNSPGLGGTNHGNAGTQGKR